MDALANAEKSANALSVAEKKIMQLEHDLTAARQLPSSNSDSSELSERLAKAENELANKLLEYNQELEKNRQLESRIAEIQKSLDVSVLPKGKLLNFCLASYSNLEKSVFLFFSFKFY